MGKQDGTALRESEARKAAMLEAALGCILGVDAGGVILECNAAAAALFGYERAQIIGEQIDALIVPLRRWREGWSTLQEFLESGVEPWLGRRVETIARRKDGSEVPIDLALTRAAIEGPPLFVAAIRDIAGRRQVQEERRQSEERLRAILDNSPTVVSVKDAEGRFVLVNQGFERLFGVTRGQVLGKTDVEVMPAGLAEAARAGDEQVRETGGHLEMEETVRRDGETRTYLSLKFPVSAPDGGHDGVCTIATDITDRKQVETGLRLLDRANALMARAGLDEKRITERLARLAVPELADWCSVDVPDDEGVLHSVAVTHRDPAKTRLLRRLRAAHGVVLDSRAGAPWVTRSGRSGLQAGISPGLLQPFARNPKHLEALRSLDLFAVMWVPFSVRGRTLGVMTLGAEAGRSFSWHDLNVAEHIARRAGLALENARLYQQHLEVEEALRSANEAKDEFLALVSHELRTPITSIFGGARLLRARGDQLDGASTRALLEDMEQESERLYRIIEDLMALARTERGEQVTTEPVLLQRVVHQVTTQFTRQHPGRRLQVQLAEDLDPVGANETYLVQVVRNLLANAHKYSPPEEPVTLRARQDGGETTFSVLDRGAGVAPGSAEEIFQPYFRSPDTAKQTRGLGIGLTVCKRLVEAQGGRIWAAPREGGGLEVAFTLPRYASEE